MKHGEEIYTKVGTFFMVGNELRFVTSDHMTGRIIEYRTQMFA
jgi:hypothetical protein